MRRDIVRTAAHDASRNIAALGATHAMAHCRRACPSNVTQYDDVMPLARLISASDPASHDLARAILARGGLVAIPTETVYGLAADAANPDAVARVFAAKGRPAHDPLIVHVHDVEHASFFGSFGEAGSVAHRLAERFWPGPLTLVLDDLGMAAEAVTAGTGHVAIRVPAHGWVRELLASRELAVAAPSANPFGYVSPTRAEHVMEQLGAVVDLVVDGGPCDVGVESTVVVPYQTHAEVLRFGGVPIEEIEALGIEVRVGRRVLERPLAPGQLARHYATRTPLVVIDVVGPAADGVALVVLTGRAPVTGYREVVELAPDGNAATAARSLFETLRRLDGAGLSRIEVLATQERGLGRALMDRVRRAAQTHAPGAP